jgi:hypothetical protein
VVVVKGDVSDGPNQPGGGGGLLVVVDMDDEGERRFSAAAKRFFEAAPRQLCFAIAACSVDAALALAAKE